MNIEKLTSCQERLLPLELLLQCCTTSILLSPDIEEPGDKVELAFRRLDSDGDGYLILDDFVHVRQSEGILRDNIVSC